MPEGGVRTSLTPSNLNMRFGADGALGPGLPQRPVFGEQPLRAWDFPVGVNSNLTPRHTEPFSFAHLRAFSNVELVRIAIETRKDQLEKLDWQIKPRDDGKASDTDPRIKEITAFLAKPDGTTSFAAFMRALDEDLLAIDASCVETVRTRGGKLAALNVVPGDTINLIVDQSGRRPAAPDDLAFQQIIKGAVWADLKNRDLRYLPRNIRPGHIYGMSPVEQMIVTINTLIRRQASQLAYFTDGNVPAGMITAPEGFSNEAIRDLQEWFDNTISGNQGAQRKVVWATHGATYTPFRDSPIKDEFDEWLARKICFAFSLPPTPFVRQMNKGTAGEDQERALEEGLEPLKLHRKRWLDELIASEWGAPDLEFSYLEERTIDAKLQCEIDDKALRNGSATIDEVRDHRGLDPLPDGFGEIPRIYLTTGALGLDANDAIAAKQAEPTPEPAPMVVPVPAKAPANANQPKPAKVAPPAATAKAAQSSGNGPTARDSALALSVDRPKALRAVAALSRALRPILAKAGHDIAAQVERRIAKAEDDPRIEAAAISAEVDLSALLAIEDSLGLELEEIGLDVVRLALGSVGVEATSDLVNRVNKRAVAYARNRAAELVKVGGNPSIVDSTREMIRRTIADGLENNIGRDAIAEALQASYAFSAERAEVIANTEISMANSAAKGEAWAEVQADGETLVKQWFVSGDEGVCPECEGNDDQGEIAMSDSFESGDDMEPAHPGCRCVTAARVLEPGESAE